MAGSDGSLILVAESGGPTMFARIGVMRALNRHIERVFNPDRKDHHWGKRKLARERWNGPRKRPQPGGSWGRMEKCQS